MAKSIEQFLVELDTNSELKAALKKNAGLTAAKYGLIDEEIALFENHNWGVLEARFSDAAKAARVISI